MPRRSRHINKSTRMNKVFGDMPKHVKNAMLYDNVAEYSFSSPYMSKMIAMNTIMLIWKRTKNAAPNPKNLVVLDAFACVGGFTIPFSRIFKYVYAIECDSTRKQMLDKNLITCKCSDNVLTIKGRCQDYLRCTNADIVFFDPPWGGPNYKKFAIGTLRLRVDDYAIEDMILDCIAPYVVVKLPINYDINHFTKMIGYQRFMKQEIHDFPHKCIMVYLKM